jgi:hypothetical protein
MRNIGKTRQQPTKGRGLPFSIVKNVSRHLALLCSKHLYFFSSNTGPDLSSLYLPSL